MAEGKKDPEIAALEAVHAALKPLDPEGRRKVLASVYALLEIPRIETAPARGVGEPVAPPAAPARVSTSRPVSLVEMMQDKKPSTKPERIALFAYYRDKYEGLPRFARNDLEPYFAKAKEQPPRNFDRDFVEAVRRGWIHEDAADSYITSKGIEAVEAGFPKEPRPARKSSTKTTARKKPRRRSGRKPSR